MAKEQKIRDPIHGLIVFRGNDDLDQLAWRLLNAREFQRLRRVRQLGVSEFVYPGATHTRFSHCVGVFHTARQLIEIIKRKIPERHFDADKAKIALLAALLHDIGHGPFSHTFEGAQKKRGVKKRHERWTAEIVQGDTEVRRILAKESAKLPERVGQLLLQEEPKDIYDSIVSSQFDADRLDYLRRDRYMTGIGTGGIDFDWLLGSIEVGQVSISGADGDAIRVDGLYLNHKGLQAAEGFLLSRFHLYSQVYTHKATRGAEQMLGALLVLAGKLVQSKSGLARTGLSERNPLARFLRGKPDDLENYIALDDTAIWASISAMSSAKDARISDLASRVLQRRLYKCCDVGLWAKAKGGDSASRFADALKADLNDLKLVDGATALSDRAKISAYGMYEFGERDALHKVLIGRGGNDQTLDDIHARSSIVRGIATELVYRVYVPDSQVVKKIEKIWSGI